MNAQEPDDCAARLLQPRRPPRGTLVAARCSALYLRTNLASSVALGRGPWAGEPPAANTYVRLSKKAASYDARP